MWKKIVTRRTPAASEEREIRQRCGYKFRSSLAENCCTAGACNHVEDVNIIGVPPICGRHEMDEHAKLGAVFKSELSPQRNSTAISKTSIATPHK
jgi:hypothetical protein